MATRTRTFDRRVQSSGTYTKYGTTYKPLRLLGESGKCTDVKPGWGADNALLVEYWRRECATFTGSTANLSVDKLVMTLPGTSAYPVADAHCPIENWTELAFDGAARSNPQRPSVNLPAFLGESMDIPAMLMDLPKLLHTQGLSLLQQAMRPAVKRPKKLGKLGKAGKVLAAARKLGAEAGSQYVGAQFGWKPLIGDLTLMLDLQGSIAQHLGWLIGLKNGRSIKRRIRLKTTSVTVTGNGLLESAAFLAAGNWTTVYRYERWITARWAPTPVLTDLLIPELSDAQGLVNLAMQLSTGMTRMGLMQAWWELLPWSWLYDWWFNFGQLLAIVGNSLALRLVSLCYMRTSRASRYYAVSSKPDWLHPDGGQTYDISIRKYRKDIRPYLALLPTVSTLPVLSGRQAGILTGLLAQYQSKGLHR